MAKARAGHAVEIRGTVRVDWDEDGSPLVTLHAGNDAVEIVAQGGIGDLVDFEHDDVVVLAQDLGENGGRRRVRVLHIELAGDDEATVDGDFGDDHPRPVRRGRRDER